jgi:hypothetical protein
MVSMVIMVSLVMLLIFWHIWKLWLHTSYNCKTLHTVPDMCDFADGEVARGVLDALYSFFDEKLLQ